MCHDTVYSLLAVQSAQLDLPPHSLLIRFSDFPTSNAESIDSAFSQRWEALLSVDDHVARIVQVRFASWNQQLSSARF